MSLRKPLAARKPCGRTKPVPRTELASPTEIRRLAGAAMDGLRGAEFCNQAGRLYLTGKISAIEYAAAKHWAALTAEYSVACQSPQQPKTKPLDIGRSGQPTDPDSEAGAREARRHEKASAAFADGRYALKNAGRLAEQAVESVVIRDCVPAGFAELEALRTGLAALWAWWSVRHKATTR